MRRTIRKMRKRDVGNLSGSWKNQLVISEDLRGEFQGNSDGSHLAETKDDAKARNELWSLLCAERRVIPNTTEVY